ncbi:MAG: TlpA family protein disulfide reductase [Hyphomicrobiaceae bacterium]
MMVKPMQTLQRGRFYPIWLAGLLLALVASWAQAGGFKLTDTEGKVHTLAGYKGKWVLVNFWATWCPPCQEEIPDLIALHENKKNNLVVIGIAMDYRNAQQVTDFAEGLLVDYPIVLGNAQVAGQIGPIEGLPTTYLYNPDGKMVAQQVGAITRESVESFIARKEPRSKK